jgi:carbonic anhydrase
MKRTPLLLTSLLLCALAASAALAETGHAPHWTYAGTEKWADLDKGFVACKYSKEQSPINIDTGAAHKAALPKIDFSYPALHGEIINNGHTIQVNVPPGGKIKIGADEFQLLQFHFHTPSEEKIDGQSYPMVVHIVHKGAGDQLAVVAVLLKEGKENPALKTIFNSLPAKEGEKKALTIFDLAAILPEQRGYYAFMGSLTTPPCSDGVRWQVLQQSIEISSGQLASFRKLYSMNARPVQPLNGREIKVSN